MMARKFIVPITEKPTQSAVCIAGMLTVGIAVVFLLVSQDIGRAMQSYVGMLGLTPSRDFDLYKALTFLSYGFVHVELGHLLTNLLGIWGLIFWLRAKLLPITLGIIFLIGIIASGITHMLVFAESSVPLIGASGGVAALMGVGLACRIPDCAVRIAFGAVVALISAAIIYGMIISDPDLPIAGDTSHVAHGAGFASGCVMALMLRLGWRYK